MVNTSFVGHLVSIQLLNPCLAVLKQPQTIQKWWMWLLTVTNFTWALWCWEAGRFINPQSCCLLGNGLLQRTVFPYALDVYDSPMASFVSKSRQVPIFLVLIICLIISWAVLSQRMNGNNMFFNQILVKISPPPSLNFAPAFNLSQPVAHP